MHFIYFRAATKTVIVLSIINLSNILQLSVLIEEVLSVLSQIKKVQMHLDLCAKCGGPESSVYNAAT